MTPVVAAFTCARCGGRASTLSLLGPDDPDPRDPGSAFPTGLIRLSIDGPIGVTHGLVGSMAARADALSVALRAGDAEAVHAIDFEYAPFWCPTCAASYCAACLVIRVDMDEGFYDATQARCPRGHERMIDD